MLPSSPQQCALLIVASTAYEAGAKVTKNDIFFDECVYSWINGLTGMPVNPGSAGEEEVYACVYASQD